jgi:hypothetical protein
MPRLAPNITYAATQPLFVPMGAGNIVPGEIIFEDGIEVRGAGVLAQDCGIAADGVDGTISAVIDSARVQMRKEVVDVGGGNTGLNNIGVAFTRFVDTEGVPVFNLAVGSDSAVLPYKMDTFGLYTSDQSEPPLIGAVYEVDALGNFTFQNGAMKVAGGNATAEQATFVIADADASYIGVKAPDQSRFDIGIGATSGERWTENELSIWSIPNPGAPKEVLHVGATGIAAFPQETVIVGSTGAGKHTEVVSGVEFSGVKMVGADGVSSGVLAYGTGVDAIWPAGQLALQQVGATGVYTNVITIPASGEVGIYGAPVAPPLYTELSAGSPPSALATGANGFDYVKWTTLGGATALNVVAGGVYMIQGAYQILASSAGYTFTVAINNGANDVDILQNTLTDAYITGAPLRQVSIPFSTVVIPEGNTIEMYVRNGNLASVSDTTEIDLFPVSITRIR